MEFLLSKSTYLRGLHCAKSLYLYKKTFVKRAVATEEQQISFDRGNRVGVLAQQLFPGGKDAGWNSPVEFRESIEKTQKFINEGVETIYEATFLYKDTLVALDILHKNQTGWHAYEVKSSLNLYDRYIFDAALQNHVIEGAGIDLQSFSVVTLNRDYVRGHELNIQQLFKIHNVTAQVQQMQTDIIDGLENMRGILNSKRMPHIEIGQKCLTPWPCEYVNYCWKGISFEKSIFEFSELEEEKRWMLFDKGILQLHELPYELELSQKQQIQLNGILNNEMHFDKQAVNQWFQQIKSPFAVVDFQYIMPAVPLLAGQKPYGKQPFQFSVYRKNAEVSENERFYNLCGLQNGCLQDFAEAYLKAIEGLEQILMFNADEAIWAIRMLAARIGGQTAKKLHQSTNIILDFQNIFKERLFYHPKMGSSIDLDAVLPVFGLDNFPLLCPLKSDNQAKALFEALWNETSENRILYFRHVLETYGKHRGKVLNELLDILQNECITVKKFKAFPM